MRENKKISKSGFRFIEKLLYDYKKLDILIAEYEAELNNVIERIDEIYGSISQEISGMPHSTNINSPTENIAIKRADNYQVKYLKNRIDEMKRHKEAIDKILGYLTDTEKLFIKLKYEREKTSRECMKEMYIEKSRWYEMRQEIIIKISEYLGVY